MSKSTPNNAEAPRFEIRVEPCLEQPQESSLQQKQENKDRLGAHGGLSSLTVRIGVQMWSID